MLSHARAHTAGHSRIYVQQCNSFVLMPRDHVHACVHVCVRACHRRLLKPEIDGYGKKALNTEVAQLKVLFVQLPTRHVLTVGLLLPCHTHAAVNRR